MPASRCATCTKAIRGNAAHEAYDEATQTTRYYCRACWTLFGKAVGKETLKAMIEVRGFERDSRARLEAAGCKDTDNPTTTDILGAWARL